VIIAASPPPFFLFIFAIDGGTGRFRKQCKQEYPTGSYNTVGHHGKSMSEMAPSGMIEPTMPQRYIIRYRDSSRHNTLNGQPSTDTLSLRAITESLSYGIPQTHNYKSLNYPRRPNRGAYLPPPPSLHRVCTCFTQRCRTGNSSKLFEAIVGQFRKMPWGLIWEGSHL
jgi:hypothetical protein